MRAEQVPLALTGETMRDLIGLAEAAYDLQAPCTQYAEAWQNPKFSDQAKSLCQSCPLLDGCREFAITTRQYGVWGGMNDDDRATERRRRSGKRKAAAARRKRFEEKQLTQPVLDEQLLGVA